MPVAARSKPPDFEKEGAAIRAAIGWLLLDHADLLNCLERSFVDYGQAVESEASFKRRDGARNVMRHLLNVKRLPANLVEELRKASGYTGRDLAKIQQANAGREAQPPIECHWDKKPPRATRSATRLDHSAPPSHEGRATAT